MPGSKLDALFREERVVNLPRAAFCCWEFESWGMRGLGSFAEEKGRAGRDSSQSHGRSRIISADFHIVWRLRRAVKLMSMVRKFVTKPEMEQDLKTWCGAQRVFSATSEGSHVWH